MEKLSDHVSPKALDSYRISYISCRTVQRYSSEFEPCVGCWYLEDICAYVYISNNLIHIRDLTNAMRRGRECDIYQLSMRDSHSLGKNWDGTPRSEHPINPLVWIKQQHIPTIKALYQIVRQPLDIEGLAYLTYTYKACATYSPFVTVKPIITPQKWMQAHVWKAILSGQIYRGKIDHIYTDDYRRDALCNCRRDEELFTEHLLGEAEQLLARELSYHVSASENIDGTAEIRLFDLNSSYTLYYDPKRSR